MGEGKPVLPSGTITFLFTDIELSTQTMAAMGDEAYADALGSHRAMLREAFAANGGHEMGTEGDSFFVAFARANDAVAAAVQGQKSLREHPLRVRMGIHTGEALVRGAEYVGHDVHRAKRISDAGHGGQILLSETTADLIGKTSLLDLGPHRLKDLTEPQRIYQVTADGLTSDFPALRSLESFKHNLPLQRSSFIGRDNEIALVRKLLDEHRIVTLTGVGGCGKTRLALQVGAELLDSYPDGVFFADLAPVSEPGMVLTTVAVAVGVPMSDAATATVTGPTDQVLIDFLKRRNCLVIVDNCEHLIDACADLADRILSSCPDVTILATSREGLELEGERALTVPSMSVPDAAGEADRSEAVSLFKARAAEVRPGFELTPDNIDAVVSICRRLDGIPLAIEFAASRVSHLTPREIDVRLAESFRLLAGGRRRVQRQQTIAATLDWSHDLLNPEERVLLRRLSVFAGSFTLEAAEGTCGADIGGSDVVDILASLVAKSLVEAGTSTERTRYRLLETVRLYAADKLKEAGESEQTHARHRDAYLAWVEEIPWDHVFTSSQVLRSLRADEANLFAALEWSAGEDRPDLVARMVARMSMIWFEAGERGQRWSFFARAEDLDIGIEERVAYLLAGFGTAMWRQSGESIGFADRAIAAAEGHPCLPLALALMNRALLRSVEAAFTRDPEAAARCHRELDEAGEMAARFAPFAAGVTNYFRAGAEISLGAFDQATRSLEHAVSHLDPEHHGSVLLGVLSASSALAHVAGRHEVATERARRALASIEEWTNWRSGPAAAAAAAFAGSGDIDGAKEVLRRWTDDVRRSGTPGTVEELMVGFAAVLALDKDTERASRLLSWVRARTLDRVRPLRSPVTYPLYLHYVRIVREALGPDAARRAREDGRAMSEDEAVACALEGLDA